MKRSNHDAHIQKFELQFLALGELHSLNNTHEDLNPVEAQFSNLVNSQIQLSLGNQDNGTGSKVDSMGSIQTQKKENRAPRSAGGSLIPLYIFNLKINVLETILAYLLFFILLVVEDRLQFPVFNCLITLNLFFILQPYRRINLLIIVLGIPICIVDYYIKVSILTYPSVFIIYFSLYLFYEHYKMSLLWVFNILLLASFGFLALPRIYDQFNGGSSTGFYLLFCFLIYCIRLVLALSNHSIKHSSEPLVQLPLFLLGLQYGMLLGTDSSKVDFWMVIVLLTLQIVDERVQFTFSFLKQLIGARRQRNRWVLVAKSSAHACINSFHIFILVYLICSTKLKSIVYRRNLVQFLTHWQAPIVIWLSFSLYQGFALLKLKNREDLFIMGHQFYRKRDVCRRVLCLTLGFWGFYLGLCICHSMFY